MAGYTLIIGLLLLTSDVRGGTRSNVLSKKALLLHEQAVSRDVSLKGYTAAKFLS